MLSSRFAACRVLGPRPSACRGAGIFTSSLTKTTLYPTGISTSSPSGKVRMASIQASTNGSVAVRETSPTRGDTQASNVIDFLEVVRNLKTLKRQGWVNRGVDGAESISDHMHRMALIALVMRDTPGIDRDRCIKIAVVHDVAEAIVGDITPACGVPKEEKRRREAAAMDTMCATLGPLGDEMRQLWEEYEAATTEEAKLVKDFDKVEMILQAWEYEREQGKDLGEFFVSTAGKFQTEIGRAYAKEVCDRRASWLSSQELRENARADKI